MTSLLTGVDDNDNDAVLLLVAWVARSSQQQHRLRRRRHHAVHSTTTTTTTSTTTATMTRKKKLLSALLVRRRRRRRRRQRRTTILVLRKIQRVVAVSLFVAVVLLLATVDAVSPQRWIVVVPAAAVVAGSSSAAAAAAFAPPTPTVTTRPRRRRRRIANKNYNDGIPITNFLLFPASGATVRRQQHVPSRRRCGFLSSKLMEDDVEYLQQAVECAKLGYGRTFPNPAVGCVLVATTTTTTTSSENENESATLSSSASSSAAVVIGKGFHPKAGYPHAEIFALLEASGHVDDGVRAALSVLVDGEDATDGGDGDSALRRRVRDLTDLYASTNGARSLFEGSLSRRYGTGTTKVTAYVTLEPCCHYGKTPPCATSLALAEVSRVVVGFRDPNPRVDGGGVSVLRQAGIVVDMANDGDGSDDDDRDEELRRRQAEVHWNCSDLVVDFCKRITPREEDTETYGYVTGAMRSALRGLANRYKQQGKLAQVSWGGQSPSAGAGDGDDDDDNNIEEAVDSIQLVPEWMEHVDGLLWRHELVLLRLSKAVDKKKHAKRLGQRIARELQAHVAQTVGHTVLLYRPGVPPVLDLQQLVEDANGSKQG